MTPAINILRLSAAALLAAAFTLPASGQKKIEAVVRELTDNNKVEVIYSEQRDPATRAVTSSSHVLTSSDPALYKKVYDAIQAERPNSTNYSQVGKEIITIGFFADGQNTSYSLIRDDDDGEWMLSTSNQQGSKRTSGRSKPSVTVRGKSSMNKGRRGPDAD